MRDKLEEIFGIANLLPAHQGRACENILATRFVKPGNCVIMNYHFTTAKAHITRIGGHVEELVKAEGLVSKSSLPFKGDIDLEAVRGMYSKGNPGECGVPPHRSRYKLNRRAAHFLREHESCYRTGEKIRYPDCT